MKTRVALISLTLSLSTASAAFAQMRGLPDPSRASPALREDLDADGRVTRLETRRAALALFARFDANGDGQVTRIEADERAHRWRLERNAVRFERLDADGDGRLSSAELGPKRRLAALDRDGDGYLTRVELSRNGEATRCRGGEEAALRSWLWRRDLDRDGLVTRLEVLRAAERRFDRKDRNRDRSLTAGEPRRGSR
jgi:Ca2+-binding EF-hand superfamily protein